MNRSGGIESDDAALTRSGQVVQWRVKFGAALGWAFLLGPSLWAPLVAQAADLETIRERGHLVVAVKANSPPMGFQGDDGRPQGLEVDIAHQLAAFLLGDPAAVELVPVTNAERIPLLLDDGVDAVVARLSVTEQRSRLVNFSHPYYYDGAALVTRQANLRDFTDIGAGPVAVLTGSNTIDALRWHLPDATLVGVASYQEALALLESGGAIAFGGDATILTGWGQEYPEYRLLPTLLSADALAVGLPKGLQYHTLHQEVDSAIEAWQATGWLRDRIRHWGLPLDNLNESGSSR
ncbi:MAG: transporter substrate-binding domain-containing protein [Elainellaceae cyanobacterium]